MRGIELVILPFQLSKQTRAFMFQRTSWDDEMYRKADLYAYVWLKLQHVISI